MSSFKNAAKSRHTHRERQQLESRQHLGFLEKKKDYKLRAADFNKKQKVLKRLRVKALDKNPDEFNYHMINSKIVDGEHTEKSSWKRQVATGQVLTPEQVAIMQTQDLNYIVSKRTSERRKIDKLQSRLHLISSDSKPQNKHTIFVKDEKEKRSLDLAARLDTHPALLDRTYNRPRLGDLKTGKFNSCLDPEQATSARKETAKMYKELEQRLDREEKLGVIHRKMELKSLLKSKNNKPEKKIKEETPNSAPVYVWAKERKR